MHKKLILPAGVVAQVDAEQPKYERLCEVPTERLADNFMRKFAGARGHLPTAKALVMQLVHGLRVEFGQIIRDQDKQVADAVAAEREAIAKLCEQKAVAYDYTERRFELVDADSIGRHHGECYAQAIRARGQQQPAEPAT